MKSERFRTFTSSMIAIVTVLGALVTWRAAAASQEAGDADITGLAAMVNNEEARIVNTIRVSEHYQAFIDYTRYNELGYLYYDAWKSTSFEDTVLEKQKSDAWGTAYALQVVFFPSKYLKTDGTYDAQREMDEAWAEAYRSRDLKAEAHFASADALRRKANLLMQMLIFFGVSFWFFTLAQVTERNLKYAFAFGGGFLLALGSLAALIIDIVM